MDERQARDVIAVKAIETCDEARRIWSDEDRAWATHAAAEVVTGTAADEAFLACRARLALDRLSRLHPAAVRAFEAFRWRGWIAPAVLLGALALGFAVDRIGGTGHVNILAPPVLGLLAWNIAVYGLLASRIVAARMFGTRAGALRRIVEAVAASSWWPKRRVTLAPLARALQQFVREWAGVAHPLYATRVARLLHLAAAAIALGAVLGMYARGTVFEYRASWESTFLDARQVHAIVAVVLTPAAAMTGIAVPSVERIAALRATRGSGGENAATWLHLYAATLVLFVLLPRAALATVAALRAARLRRRLQPDLADAYTRKLLRSFRQGPLSVVVQPYSYAPAPQAIAALQATLERLFGRASICVAPPAPYGTEATASAELAAAGLIVILFQATATPEAATHAAFVRELAALGSPAADRLVVVDETAFRERWPHDQPRLDGRRAIWREVLGASAPIVFADLGAFDIDSAARVWERALTSTAA